ncbi:MAG: hypothetical protein ACE37J_15135 [Pikeienuella sp.]|uniref:hypothetical protein n=1 Tax=Pikeienuella sp. TaxID=2831957 RepID=UPI003919BFBC
MTGPSSDAEAAERLLAHARQLYQNLAGELSKALRTISSDEETERTKGRAETIRSHRKALQTVLEIELQFLKDSQKAETSHVIDLESARVEVYRRLDRLAASGGDRGAA